MTQRTDERIRMTSEEVLALRRQWLEFGNVEARDEILSAHERLVHGVIRRLPGTWRQDYYDLYQEGTIGLIRAIEMFRAGGQHFPTYAKIHVRGRMTRWKMRMEGPWHIPGSMMHVWVGYGAKCAELLRAGIHPNFERVADIFGCSTEEVRQTIGRRDPHFIISYDRAASETGAIAIAEMIADENAEVVDDAAISAADCSIIGSFVSISPSLRSNQSKRELRELAKTHLSRRDIDVIVRHHGYGQTLNEIGIHYGVTRERIRQIEARALDIIRRRILCIREGGEPSETSADKAIAQALLTLSKTRAIDDSSCDAA